MDEQFSRALDVCLTVLGTTFNREVTDSLTLAYQLGLEGLTPDQLGTATKRALQSCKFFPSPAELRAYALGTPADIRTQAEQAYDLALRTINAYSPPQDLPPLVVATINEAWGDYVTFCYAPDDQWERKRFVETYMRVVAQGPLAESRRPLLGLHEAKPRGDGTRAIGECMRTLTVVANTVIS